MQGELNFYYGPMGCGKTRELLKVLHSKKEDGFYVVSYVDTAPYEFAMNGQ